MVNLRIRRPDVPARRPDLDWPGWGALEREFFNALPTWARPRFETMDEMSWAPRVDIIEKEDSWVFKAELPDIKADDIQVTLEEGILAIKGERKFEDEVKDGNFTRFERQYGTFERRFSLPSGIDPDAIRADYRNGVLTLAVPKKEEVKPKSVKIDIQ